MADQAQDIRGFYAKYGQVGSLGAPTAATSTSISTSTTTGTTTVGLLTFEIKNVGGSTGTIDGIDFPAGEGVIISENGLSLGSLSFDATGTTFRIMEVALL